MPGDSSASWVVDVFGDLLALSFVNNSRIPFFQPFYADFGGIQLFHWQKTTGLPTDATQGGIQIAPNPTHGPLRIVFPQNKENQTLELLDIHGARLKSLPFPGNEIDLDLSGLPAGVYFLRMWAGEKTVVEKVVKQ